MRKIILVAAMVLASASAHAGTRSLTLASSDEPVIAQPAAAATPHLTEATNPAEAPRYSERPAAVATTAATVPAATAPSATPATAQAPSTDATKPASSKTTAKTTAKAHRHSRTNGWTEGRIISELHRYGIYW